MGERIAATTLAHLEGTAPRKNAPEPKAAKGITRRKAVQGLTALALAAPSACALLGATACTGGTPADEQQRPRVTMYLWDKSMTRQLTPWLEEQFPDIDLTFVVGFNAMAYYSDLNDRGELPDIITCRRFSLNDAAHLSDQLLDLSQTELTGSFYSSYIDVNREPDGAIRWLPMCAEIDGIMANLDLFEQCGVKVPTDYAEFAAACAAFEGLGIEGFATDFDADYSCLETLQGCAISDLMSMEGTAWRRAYESEKAGEQVGLDDEVWPVVFEKYERFLKDACIGPEEAERSFTDTTTPFFEGKVAMIRGTANDCQIIGQRYGFRCSMLPYFGETSDDSWLLTYPICQVAVNARVEGDDAKKDAIMRVLDAMFSEEGQRRLAFGNTVLSYNKNLDVEVDQVLDSVRDCIDGNHLYMRLASTEFFAVSRAVVQSMIGDGLSAQEAYADFDARLTAVPDATPAETVFEQDAAYAYAFDDHGSAAVSSVMNTLRAQTGADIAIGYSNLVSESVFAGAYTLQQVKWIMASKLGAWLNEYTGEEVQRIMEWLVNTGEDGANPVHHANVIPGTSGLEYTARDNGDGTYTLKSATVGGKALQKDAVYTVLLIGDDNYIGDGAFCGCPMPEDLAAKRQALTKDGAGYSIYNCLIDAVTEGQRLLPPTEYVTILH